MSADREALVASDRQAFLLDLARVKALFQARQIAMIIGATPPTALRALAKGTPDE